MYSNYLAISKDTLQQKIYLNVHSDGRKGHLTCSTKQSVPVKANNTHTKHNNVAIVWTSPVAEKFFKLAT